MHRNTPANYNGIEIISCQSQVNLSCWYGNYDHLCSSSRSPCPHGNCSFWFNRFKEWHRAQPKCSKLYLIPFTYKNYKIMSIIIFKTNLLYISVPILPIVYSLWNSSPKYTWLTFNSSATTILHICFKKTAVIDSFTPLGQHHLSIAFKN